MRGKTISTCSKLAACQGGRCVKVVCMQSPYKRPTMPWLANESISMHQWRKRRTTKQIPWCRRSLIKCAVGIPRYEERIIQDKQIMVVCFLEMGVEYAAACSGCAVLALSEIGRILQFQQFCGLKDCGIFYGLRMDKSGGV